MSGWRELTNCVGEVEAGNRRDRDDGSVQTGRLVLGHALPALLRGSVDYQFVDERVGVCADIQRDDGGVIGGEDVGAGKGPAGWVPAGPWCSWWRLGGQSDVTSVAAVRALDSSTMALRVA